MHGVNRLGSEEGNDQRDFIVLVRIELQPCSCGKDYLFQYTLLIAVTTTNPNSFGCAEATSSVKP